jgi:hypothetical protein
MCTQTRQGTKTWFLIRARVCTVLIRRPCSSCAGGASAGAGAGSATGISGGPRPSAVTTVPPTVPILAAPHSRRPSSAVQPERAAGTGPGGGRSSVPVTVRVGMRKSSEGSAGEGGDPSHRGRMSLSRSRGGSSGRIAPEAGEAGGGGGGEEGSTLPGQIASKPSTRMLLGHSAPSTRAGKWWWNSAARHAVVLPTTHIEQRINAVLSPLGDC